jgi:HSP90 family molecular chaperone
MESVSASSELTRLPVTVDKSHLVTIGQRLYAESVELLRELVNNAYDADATVAHVQLSEHEITVSDNGSGMDLEGLKQYFEIMSHPRHSREAFERQSKLLLDAFVSEPSSGNP